MRLPGEDIAITAPRQYLKKLYEWCRGDKTLTEIGNMARQKWGNDQFHAFLLDMLHAGVLIDSSAFLVHASQLVRPDRLVGFPERLEHRHGDISIAKQLPRHSNHLPIPEDSNLRALITSHNSDRRSTASSITIHDLAHLVYCACGIRTNEHSECKPPSLRESGPATSALARFELVLVLLKPVESFNPGAYCVDYDSSGNIALSRKSDDISCFSRCVFQPYELSGAVGVFVLTVNLRAAGSISRNQPYPSTLIEAGRTVQNIVLASAERNLGAHALSGVFENHLQKFNIIHYQSSVLAAVAFGSRNGDSVRIQEQCEFSWTEDLPDAPFYIACARIKASHCNDVHGWGRSKNPDMAFDKAVAEAVERHAYRQTPSRVHRSKIGPSEKFIDPASIISYSAKQYKNKHFPYRPFNRDKKYSWVPACDSYSGKEIYVLAECVYHSAALKHIPDSDRYTAISSSGCASHISLESAVANATLELIERDAFMRHWFAQKGGLQIHSASLPEEIHARVKFLVNAGCEVSIQCLDAGIFPVFMAFIQHEAAHFTSVGTSACLDFSQAVDGALEEAEASALAFLGGVARNSIRPKKVHTPTDHVELYATSMHYQRADALLDLSGATSFLNVSKNKLSTPDKLYSLLKRRGYAHLWKDISIQDAPLTMSAKQLFTARAIVPGLIPITFGFGLMPLGMDMQGLPAAVFPHPFP